MPAPRPVRSSGLRSKTVTSQPVRRRRCPASSPPSEPPITSVRLAPPFDLTPSTTAGCRGRADNFAVCAGSRLTSARAYIGCCAAHLVLDGEQHGPRVEVDDILEAVLMLAALLVTRPSSWSRRCGPEKSASRSARDGRRTAVPLLQSRETQVLPGPDYDARAPSLAVIDEIGARAQDLAVEAGDPRRGAGRDVELT